MTVHQAVAGSHDDSDVDSVSGLDQEVLEWIKTLSKWLPEQRPLGVFVHQNPLGAVESTHFHVACEAATRIRGARTTLTSQRYRELVEERRIRADDLAAAKKRIATLRFERIDVLPPPGDAVLLSTVRPEMATEVGEMVDAFLIRILPAFLDLGSAMWVMPHREEGLLGVLRRLARTSLGTPEPWLAGLSARLGGPTTSALSLVVSCLEKRGDPETGWPNLIHEALFALPGYTGMIHRLEHVVAERPAGADVSLLDYLAVRLVVEELALIEISHRLFGRRATLGTLAESVIALPRPKQVEWSLELAAMQDAYEEDYVRSLLGALSMASETDREPSSPTNIHFVGCIDDRLESIRRHIEECVPNSDTVGCAGFFGIAIKHRAPVCSDETASCPAPVTPDKRVTEHLSPDRQELLERSYRRLRSWQAIAGDDASRRLVPGLLASFANIARTPRNVLEMLFPQWFVAPATEFEGSDLIYAKDVDPDGFTLEDRTNLVFRNLANIGLVRGFGRWVAIVGHGSMAVNNPFASGYQCGACGGQRGGINARIFCEFANAPEVRIGLRHLGLDIPDHTMFVPGEHDTSLDHFRWFDLDRLSPERNREFEQILADLDVALARNTKERARRFADIPLHTPIDETVARVRRRGADFAETRPEYNHATNAACIIGRRSLTRHVFLDRRPFLVSYDPTIDDDEATTLQRLMAAPLPVCAGISHEYFFSTMDPQRFGSGTKLPHNVQGLVGVSNGADGDLRPGLWTQTTEIHDPIRLVSVIEAEPETITRVLDRLPAVKHTVVNQWIHLFACSPSGRGFFRWLGRGFEPYSVLPHALFEVGVSLDACTHTRANVAPCLIVPQRIEAS